MAVGRTQQGGPVCVLRLLCWRKNNIGIEAIDFYRVSTFLFVVVCRGGDSSNPRIGIGLQQTYLSE